MELLPDRVSECLDGREVFLTGATGYVGKVLLEKLLRSCPGIKTVFVLLRAKRGKDPAQRLQDLLNSTLFEKVRRMENGALLDKVVPVEGDVSAPDLGLDESSKQLLCSSVSVVFHSAATIRFDEPLSSSVLLNARGTLLLLQLARNMPNLKCFLHVSTAYCHLENVELLEKLYPPPCDPHALIAFVEDNPTEVVDALTLKLLGEKPNTYIFTKALAESLCEEFIDELPISIVRPSIVTPIWKEPLVGWVDNLNGPVGILTAAAKGLIRSTLSDSSVAPDFIPVDIVVNGILLATWDRMNNVLEEKRERVFNVTSHKSLRITWAQLMEVGLEIADNVSMEKCIWYRNMHFTTSRFVHFTRVLFCQLLPAFLLDIVIRLAGYEPLLVRVQRRILKTTMVLQFFIATEFALDNTKFNSLAAMLNKRERKVFYCTYDDFDWRAYFYNSTKGTKCYVLNESLDNMPEARKNYRRMYWLDRIAKGLFICLLLWLANHYLHQLLPNLHSTGRLRAERFQME